MKKLELEKLIDDRIKDLELSIESTYESDLRRRYEEKAELLRRLRDALFGF